MSFKKEPKAIQRALLVATKFGFLRKETFWKYLTTPNTSYKYDLWNRLMASGYLTEYRRVGVAENYYCLSKRGISLMRDQGLMTVCKAHPLHFEHDEIVMTFALANENAGLVKEGWSTDRMLRHYLPKEQIDHFGRVFEKLPDLLFNLNIENFKIECALEVERSRKSKARYDAFVLAYAKDKNTGLVVVAYNDRYVVKSIEDAIRRLGYPQSARPIVFCRVNDLLEKPTQFELQMGNSKIPFDRYIENFRKIAIQRTENQDRKNSALDSVKSEVAA